MNIYYNLYKFARNLDKLISSNVTRYNNLQKYQIKCLNIVYLFKRAVKNIHIPTADIQESNLCLNSLTTFLNVPT